MTAATTAQRIAAEALIDLLQARDIEDAADGSTSASKARAAGTANAERRLANLDPADLERVRDAGLQLHYAATRARQEAPA